MNAAIKIQTFQQVILKFLISEFKVLNKSAVPPFTIQDDTDGGDDIRMKYRFLGSKKKCSKEKY